MLTRTLGAFALLLLFCAPADGADVSASGLLKPLLTPLAQTQTTPPTVRVCCKICRKGKACGNSCISRQKRCTKPPGCACDG